MTIDNEPHYEHRLAVFYMTGDYPLEQVDHVDMNREDNRWVNLREATVSQQRMNRRAKVNNPTGLKGVTYFKRDNCWKAQIGLNGANKYLGLFRTAEDAHAAYCAAADKMFGEFARHG